MLQVVSFFRPAYSIAVQPEVISFDKWSELKPESKGGVSSWIKDAFHESKTEMQDDHQKLNFILGTSPMWDRYISRTCLFQLSI